MIALDAATGEIPPPAFEEALRWFRGRVPMTDAAFALLSAEAQRRAFTLAGAAALTVVSDVWRSLDATLAEGRTLRDFKRDVAPALLGQWQGSVANPPWRMEVIFRNATQRAYVHGRVEQLRDPEVARLRPVWMFDAVGDARTSAICTALDGTVLAASDSWWASHTPPCHHACRSTIRGLRASDPRAKAATGAPPMVAAQTGFGALPDADDWRPRQADYPPEAWAAYRGNPQAYRAPQPRTPTVEMPVFTPPAPTPKPKTPTMEAPALVPPKAAPPPASKPPRAPKPKAAPKPKEPVRMVGPVVAPPPPSGEWRDPSTISPRETAPRMSGGPASRFADMPVVPEVEGLRWSAHDGRHYPENHLNRAYGDSVRAATDPIVKSLPASQRNALSDYTGAAYESVNAYLRDPVKFEKTNGAEAAQRAAKSAALTRSAMARMPRAPADMVLFRGLSLERDDVQADALASGSELTFPSFGSFSRSPRVARSFAAQKDVSVFYRVRRHQSGVLVEGISQIAGENEVIFPPGTRFRIVARQRVSNEALLLDIEEITDD